MKQGLLGSIPRIPDSFGWGQGQELASLESPGKLPDDAKIVRRLRFEKHCLKTCIIL